MTYDWERLLEILEEEYQKYKGYVVQAKDWEKHRAGVIITNAIIREKRHIEEILDHDK